MALPPIESPADVIMEGLYNGFMVVMVVYTIAAWANILSSRVPLRFRSMGSYDLLLAAVAVASLVISVHGLRYRSKEWAVTWQRLGDSCQSMYQPF
ncbi:hypothetical protein F5Y18DRAFT_407934 [Xylariaceae sp. FL1019]|nr:hypothetical protein F5Y18DRAFT_407934 [Xylariaceae sp. FL1019]